MDEVCDKMKKSTTKNGIIVCGGNGEISDDNMKKINAFTEKIEEWKKFRTDAISEMFENVKDCGIYPTTELYKKLDAKYIEALNWRNKQIKG